MDSSGNAYVAGYTYSSDFPTANPLQAQLGGVGVSNAFVAKLNPAGSALDYSTYLGGSGFDQGSAIAVDSSGSAYVAGFTGSSDFPTANPLQASWSGGWDTFVARLNAAGSALVYSTYLGGSGDDEANAIAVDSSGNAYVTGQTNSSNFPTVAPFQANLKSTYSSPNNKNAFVAKIAPSNEPAAALSPSSLGFAAQNVGTSSATQTVTVTNVGSQTLSISGISASAGFAETDNCSTPLAPLGNCSISVTFMPTVVGAENGTLTITDNNSGTPGSTQTVSLAGTGLGALGVVSPSGLSFGNQAVGTTSASQPVTLSNTGTTTLTITGITASGDFSQTNNCNGSVAPNGACTINVSFAPTTNGARTGTLTITDNSNNSTGSTQTVGLTGTGTVPEAGVSPTTLTFAALQVNATSSSQAVTLSNTGSLALAVASVTTSGNFAQTNNCGASVAAGGSCTINVTFAPLAGGPLTGTLTITDNSNAVTGSTQTGSLNGTGQDFTMTTSSGSSTTASAAPGQSATYTLAVGSLGGLSQPVNFTCSGAPSEATCTVSPNPLTPGSSATNITVSVATTAPSDVAPRVSPPLPPAPSTPRGLPMMVVLLAAVAWAAWAWRRLVASRRTALVPLGAGLLLAMVLAGCGGGGGGGVTPNPGTPAGTYTLTVTGTVGSGSSALSHSMTLTLTIT